MTDVLSIRNSVVNLLTRNGYVVARNVEGITHEQTLVQIGPGGSSLNWLLGHMVASRDVCIRLLEAEPVWSKERGARYNRGSEVGNAADAEPLEALLAAHTESGTKLIAALNSADAASLARPNPRNNSESVMDAIHFLVWHDTYHTGQTALYRRMAGLDGVF